MRAQILMNMASKDKYKSLLERYKQALIKNPKLNLSAYCRLNGVSVSGMHHYIEDVAPYGRVFIFYGKNHQSVKLLRWDTDGFVLYQKRLEKGTFEIPKFDGAAGGYRMPWKTFSMIMQGVSLRSARYRKRFKIEV